MMKNAVFPAGLFIAAAALTGCLFGNSSEDSAPGRVVQTTPYKVEGNTIITLPHARSDAYCDGDELQTETDTMDTDTVAFQITGSTFTVFANSDTLMTSGAVTQQVVVFTRQGSGSGLEGLWLNTSQEVRVVSGTPSEEEAAELEDDRKYTAAYRAYYRSWVRFSDGKITSYADQEFANQFVSDWNDEFDTERHADSARYAITAKTVDRNTVELKGRENGETVRLTLDFDGMTYSSDTPGHATHRYHNNPKTCPNEYTPAWYEEFLDANRNLMDPEDGFGLEKTAENQSKKAFSRHFPFGPLKTVYSLLN